MNRSWSGQSLRGSSVPRTAELARRGANEGVTDVEALAHHAGELRKRGVVTSTVGIGDGYDEALLAAIVENDGGRLHDAERTDEIGSVLLGEIGEAMAQAADSAMLVLALPAGVRAEPVGISGAEITSGQMALPLGGISAGLARTAVVRPICPSGQPAASLDVRLSATAMCSVTGGRLRAGPSDCRLPLPVAARTATSPAMSSGHWPLREPGTPMLSAMRHF